MPVTRYRDVAAVPPPSPRDPLDPRAAARALAHMEAMTRDLPPLYAPGVRRFASIEAAQADRERAIVDRMRRWRTARSKGQA
jgi:hypothetical protein